MKSKPAKVNTADESYGTTYLEDINTLSSDMTKKFIFVVEMAPKHLGTLVDGVLNFYGNTTTCL